jgi:hypothetical protein
MRSSLQFCAWIPAAILGSVVGACLDFTPITTLATADAADSATTLDDAGTVQTACLSCAVRDDDAGGCSGEFDRCNAFAVCESTVACVVGQCFNPGVNITECLGWCEADGGIMSSQGPPNAAFAAFLECMSTRCVSVCFR